MQIKCPLHFWHFHVRNMPKIELVIVICRPVREETVRYNRTAFVASDHITNRNPWTILFFSNYPDSMNNTGDIPQEREKNINPKVHAKTNLEKNADGRKYYCKDYSNYVHFHSYFIYFFELFEKYLSKLFHPCTKRTSNFPLLNCSVNWLSLCKSLYQISIVLFVYIRQLQQSSISNQLW